MGPSLWLTRTATAMGVVALLLAAMGLFAVASYVAAQRSREFAIRIALGARPSGVLALVLRQSMRMVAIGLIIGGTIALGVTQVFRTQFMAPMVSTTRHLQDRRLCSRYCHAARERHSGRPRGPDGIPSRA